VFTASDANFTATFPGTPRRTAQTVKTIVTLTYSSQLSSHEVSVSYIPLSSPQAFSLDGGITGAVAAVKGGKVLSRTSLTYQGQAAEDGVISFSGGIAQLRVVAFGAAAYILAGTGSTAASFRDDYNLLLDTFTSTSPVTGPTATPTGTGSGAGTGSLASEIIPPPSGFAADPSADGPVTAAEFDSATGAAGTAAALHYVAGYQVTYTKVQDTELLFLALYQFSSPTDAAAFLGDVPSDTATMGTDRALPGSVTLDSKTADSTGQYNHAEVAARGSTVVFVEYDNGSKTRPTAVLGASARQQYARL
jgi:hypothetical protein